MPYRDPEKQKAFQREWRTRKKRWYQALKATLKCERCGFSHPAALQFHHRGNKDREVSRMVNSNCSVEDILAEIAKCDVPCANCHALEHAVEPAF